MPKESFTQIHDRIQNELKAPPGKFRVVMIDKYEIPGDAHYSVGIFGSINEAINILRKLEEEHKNDEWHEFIIYDENGYRKISNTSKLQNWTERS